jgi:hypothetical protein
MITTEKIRKIWLLGLALVMVGLSGSNAFALDFLGPPVAEIEKEMFGAGIEYSFSSIDLDLIEGDLIVYQNGEFLGSGTAPSVTVKDVEVNTLYATFGYGIVENYEVFLRMGLASGKFGDSLWEEGEDFDSNVDFAIGAGFKATFYKGFDWKVGGIFQISMTELDGKLESSAWSIYQPNFVEISSTEMQIAIGVNYLRSSRLSIYGGPFVHFISGDFDYKFTRIGENFDTGEYSWEFSEGPTYGGYIGAQVKVVENGFANVEYQQTSDADFIGASFLLKY